jgi:hypothetical protein
LLPPPGQVEFTDLQEEKRQEKENGKRQVLASMVPSPGADTNWIKVALQEKSKQVLCDNHDATGTQPIPD